MKPSWCVSLAFASALVALSPTWMSARPRYGGTLRIETQSAPRTLDPSSWPSDTGEAAIKERLASLVFDTLIHVDASGALRPGLALAWQHDATWRRWELRLRPGVHRHDGALLEAAHVAAALRSLLPGRTVKEIASGLEIESPAPDRDLPLELASPRRAIAFSGSGGLVGTGPFVLERWEPGREATFRAHDASWSGRPFLDAVHVAMNRRPRDQAVDLELGRADLVTVQPQDARRLAQRGFTVTSGEPADLVALVPDAPGAGGYEAVSRALSLGVDRAAICNVLLQRQGEPARSLLPQWLSGYALSFPLLYDRAAARAAAAALTPTRPFVLQFDANDAVAQAIAERVVVDARESGVTLTAALSRALSGPRPDFHLVRVRLETASPADALVSLVAALRLDGALPAALWPLPGDRTLDTLRNVEQSLLSRCAVVPLVHLPELLAASPRVAARDGALVLPAGRWRLADAWLLPEKP